MYAFLLRFYILYNQCENVRTPSKTQRRLLVNYSAKQKQKKRAYKKAEEHEKSEERTKISEEQEKNSKEYVKNSEEHTQNSEKLTKKLESSDTYGPSTP